MDAVRVFFAVRVREVAEQHDCGALVRVGDDACAGETRLAECVRRDARAHELFAVQFPAECRAGVLGGGGARGYELRGIFLREGKE